MMVTSPLWCFPGLLALIVGAKLFLDLFPTDAR
jgi:hypothetical protein